MNIGIVIAIICVVCGVFLLIASFYPVSQRRSLHCGPVPFIPSAPIVKEGWEVGCYVKCKHGRNRGKVGMITEIHHDWYNKGNQYCMKTTIQEYEYATPDVYVQSTEEEFGKFEGSREYTEQLEASLGIEIKPPKERPVYVNTSQKIDKRF
jgi:hypothetical protein